MSGAHNQRSLPQWATYGVTSGPPLVDHSQVNRFKWTTLTVSQKSTHSVEFEGFDPAEIRWVRDQNLHYMRPYS